MKPKIGSWYKIKYHTKEWEDLDFDGKARCVGYDKVERYWLFKKKPEDFCMMFAERDIKNKVMAVVKSKMTKVKFKEWYMLQYTEFSSEEDLEVKWKVYNKGLKDMEEEYSWGQCL